MTGISNLRSRSTAGRLPENDRSFLIWRTKMSELKRAVFAHKNGDAQAAEFLSEAAQLGHADAGDVMLEEVYDAMKLTDLPFTEAFERVCKANPELHRAYLNSNS